MPAFRRSRNPVSAPLRGGARASEPAPRRPHLGHRVRLAEVRLLCPRPVLDANTDAEAVTAFIDSVRLVAERVLGENPYATKVLAQFRCAPRGHSVQLAVQALADEAVMARFQRALEELPPLPVSREPVSFHIEFHVAVA